MNTRKATEYISYTRPPFWATEAIWYQIMVERFYNSDPFNNPTTDNMKGAWPHNYPDNWAITPWTQDWYANAPHSPDLFYIKKWYNQLQGRRYGGDLQGVIDKLDYLQNLGINALYLTPINDAPSLHKYDARNYHHIDIHFGPDPKGDEDLIKNEDPSNPKTWRWTSADIKFLELVEEVHAKKMHIIVDFSFNHTGIEFWAWKDILKNGINSKFAPWYQIEPKKKTHDSDLDFQFQGWSGVKELPELKKLIFTEKTNGKPYDGDLYVGVKNHIFNCVKRWLAPMGNIDKGIDGIRVDVADQIGLNFWREFRHFVKEINPNALIVGEVWWEQWPDTMMNPRPFLTNGIFDSIMFYQPYRFTRAFFSKNKQYEGAEGLVKNLELATYDMPRHTIENLMVMSASHDSPRLLSSFYNKGEYKYLAKPLDDVFYKTEQPDEETYRRVRNFIAFQFTTPGAPQIWAGDEMGMWGADDPDCRKPLWWPEFNFEEETTNPFEDKPPKKQAVGFNQEHFDFYKKIISIRKSIPELEHGHLKYLYKDKDLLVYKRYIGDEETIMVFNNHTETIDILYKGIIGYDLWEKERIVDELRDISPLSFKIIKMSKPG